MQTKTIGHNGATLVVPQSYEFQNGRQPSRWEEIGTSGLDAFSGFIMEAFNAELFWPGVEPEYERLRRSCPPIVMTRQTYTAQAGEQNVEVVLPEDPTPPDNKMGDLFKSELDNMEGGFEGWINQYLSQVPFKGWGWWEIVGGVRSKNWRPPGDDDWESEADDGMFGIRRLAWRDQSSFDKWELTDETGRLKGMWQNDYPNPRILIPKKDSLHVTFGDNVNPEGLTPMEAVWRLEYIQRGYEVVFGIGAEHAAGYLDVRKTVDSPLSPEDKSNIRQAARAILSAQEGNYAAWPFGFEGKVMDIPFSAAANILEAIRYYGLLILQLYNMGHIAIATTADTGSYSARESGSSDFLFGYNSMVAGAVKQYDNQVGRMLYRWNASRFPGARRPKYKAKPLEKLVGLGELAEFWQIISSTMPVGEQDYIEIRTRSGILPETLPEPEEIEAMPDGTNTTTTAATDTPENVNTKGLNGAQITAVLDVLGKMATGEINRVVALELLIAVGIDTARARRIVSQDVDIKPDTAEKDTRDMPEPDEEDEGDLAEMASRPFAVGKDERPDDIGFEAVVTEADINRAVGKFRRWAETNEPRLARLLDAEVVDESEN